MPKSRFPKAKYLRELSQMRQDLWWWAASYHEAAQHTPVEWLQGRFMDRGHLIEDVLHDLDVVRSKLEQLPRLS